MNTKDSIPFEFAMGIGATWEIFEFAMDPRMFKMS